ncbi:MAG TPA: acetyl-CoA C-acetyltransferase [Vicinamibacterales bacterium]|nr:acetyl-CoA C-acetyltransferase [Vicinamibacterales bacterium]
MGVVIVSAARTATGKFLGSLKPFTAPQLGAIVIREAVARAGIDPGIVEECIMGNVVSAGLGQAPARQAALRGGLGNDVAALTINKVCGSGLKAVMLAAQGITTGDADVVVAGGMESMSNCPYLLAGAREGLRLGHGQAVDSLINDGLWCTFEDWHMGNAGEVVAVDFGITREAQDTFALNSHRKAADATAAGRFRSEIVPVSIPAKKGDLVIFDRDESIRPETSMEALAALRPAFKADGTVTAGNAPPVNDGAAALVVMSERRARELNARPMARIVGQAASGLAPKYVLMTPVEAIRRLAKKIGWSLADVDLFEINEAFSVQLVAILGELGIDANRVNVNGGAVALGHPIGASGARILTTLLYALENRGLRCGIAALCLGGGNGVAMAVERV